MRIQDINSFKQKALKWAASFEVCCLLDSNGYTDQYGRYDLLLAAGASKQLNAGSVQKFSELKSFYDLNRQWMFGLLSYDLKNEIEHLDSSNPDYINFPGMFFFIPQYLVAVKDGQVEVLIGEQHILDTIEHIETDEPLVKNINTGKEKSIHIQNRISKAQYLKTVAALQQHISRGDIYEINFCQEFFAEHAAINPVDIYQRLNKVSPTPFSGFFRIKDQYILSASPERFLCKRDNKLISQPIKGTAKRSTDPEKGSAD